MPEDPERTPKTAGLGSIPPRTYRPFATKTRETPMFHMMAEPLFLSFLQPLLIALYRLRALLSFPMHFPVFPGWLAARLPNVISLITVGDLILMTPLLLHFLRGYHYAFVAPSTEYSGYEATFAIYWAFLSASKSNSAFSFVLGIPFDRLITFHWVASFMAVVLGIFHAYVAFNFSGLSQYSNVGTDTHLMKYLWDGRNNVSGSLALLSFLILVASSAFPIVRRMFFNLWYLIHVSAATCAIVALLLHDVTSMVIILAWWGLDLVVRYSVMAGCRFRAKARLRRVGTGDAPVIELTFKKPAGFDYTCGTFAQLALPKLSVFEFHPFSISSAPHQEECIFHIRELGDWTNRLVQLADENGETDVWMEGPYGSANLDDDEQHKMVLLIAGGIGITPCQSIGSSLLHEHAKQGRNLKYLKLVWAVRHMSLVGDIPPLDALDDFSKRSTGYRRHRERFSQSGEKGDASLSVPMAQAPMDRQDNRTTKRRPAVVQVDIHCTRRPSEEEEVLDEGNTSLPFNFKYGRPDVDAVFQEMKEAAIAMGESNVTVVTCGPTQLLKEVQAACHRHTASVTGASCRGEGIFFDLHKEKFEL